MVSLYDVPMIEMQDDDFTTVLEALRFFHEMTGDNSDVVESLKKLEKAYKLMESYA